MLNLNYYKLKGFIEKLKRNLTVCEMGDYKE